MVQYYYIQTTSLDRMPLGCYVREYTEIVDALAQAYQHMRYRTGDPIALIDHDGTAYDPQTISQMIVDQFGALPPEPRPEKRYFRGKDWEVRA